MSKGLSRPLVPVTVVRATRADSDEQLLSSWLSSLTSAHTRRNFETTARGFLASLQMGLRGATVEDVRDAFAAIAGNKSEASARQYVLRAKSLLSYAQRIGYTPFNAGAVIKVRSETAHRGANLAKRIIHGEACGCQGRHCGRSVAALVAPRPRFARDRPWRIAPRGPEHIRSRQHCDHIRLSACADRQLERFETRSWGVPSMMKAKAAGSQRQSSPSGQYCPSRGGYPHRTCAISNPVCSTPVFGHAGLR